MPKERKCRCVRCGGQMLPLSKILRGWQTCKGCPMMTRREDGDLTVCNLLGKQGKSIIIPSGWILVGLKEGA